METVLELLRSAGFRDDGDPLASRRTFTKPGTAFQATVGSRYLRLIRVDGKRAEDIRLVASASNDDLAAVVSALRATERAA